MSKVIIYIYLLLFVLITGCDNAVDNGDGDEYVTVNPSATANYTHASFAFHVPESYAPLRGILVVVPGYNSDGTYYKDDPVFQHLSTTLNVAVLACYYRGDSEHKYSNATGGSGKALLRAIEEFAFTLNRPEIENLPLLFWGHSAGGKFSYSFMNWKPSMVACCVALRSSNFDTEPSDSAKNVPATFLFGENDDTEYNSMGIEFCKNNRKEGALWSYAIEPYAGHGHGLSDYFYIPFFEEVIRSRLNYGAGMTTIEESSGWLGEYNTHSVYEYNDYPGEKREAAWFFNETIAERWKKYQDGNFE